jgi:hypothetical protein
MTLEKRIGDIQEGLLKREVTVLSSEEEFFDHVMGLLRASPEKHEVSYGQVSFWAVIAAGLQNEMSLVSRAIPEITLLPYKEFDTLMAQVWHRPIKLGIELFSALQRPPTIPPIQSMVGFEDVWSMAMEYMNVESAQHDIFVKILSTFGPVYLVGNVLASSMVEGIMHHPIVSKNAQKFFEMIATNITFGMAIEYAYATLSLEKRRLNAIIAALVKEKAGIEIDEADPDFEKTLLESNLGKMALETPEVYPWPRDEICRCGHSLKPFVFCCNPHEPFSISELVESFGVDHVLHRQCCGAELPGFACDLCGRVYTWQKGLVDSVGLVK